MSKTEEAVLAVKELVDGQEIHLNTSMGSYGRMWVEDGALMAEVHGLLPWQKYGPKPAREFNVRRAYGMGNIIKLITAIYEG